MILVRMTSWLKSANSILNNILHENTNEQNIKHQKNGLEAIAHQLNEHQRHISYLKRRFSEIKADLVNIDNQDIVRENRILLLEHNLIELVEKIEMIKRVKITKQPIENNNNDCKDSQTQASSKKLDNLLFRPITKIQLNQEFCSTLSEEQPSSSKQPMNFNIIADKNIFQQQKNQQHSPDLFQNEATNICKQLNLESQLDNQQQEEINDNTLLNIPVKNCNSISEELNNWITEHELELKEGEVRPGNVDELKLQLQNCDALIAEVREKLFYKMQFKTNDEVNTHGLDKFLRSAETKRNNIVDSINKTQLAIHKFVKAEECADRYKIVLDRLKMRQKEISLYEFENELKVY